MKKKRPSGPSGRNAQAARILRGSPEFWALLDRAVEQANETYSDWARRTLAAAAELELRKAPTK